jgi:predicted deacylase
MNYAEYTKKLKAICRKKRINLKKIGIINKIYPLYKITLTPKEYTKTICFSAGLHGEEFASPLAILKFLKEFKKEKNKVKIIIFPVASPSAFDKHQRYNYKNLELNDLFCKKRLQGENKMLYNSLKNEKIDFFHSLHEDCDATSFYMYIFEKKKEKIYRDTLRLAKRYFPINIAKTIYNDKAVRGLIINKKDDSFEDRMFRDNTPYSVCTETPGACKLSKRIALSVDIMNKFIGFLNHKSSPR